MIRLSVDLELQRPFIFFPSTRRKFKTSLIFFVRQEQSSKQAVIRKEREEVQNTLRIASTIKETRKKSLAGDVYTLKE